MSRSIIHSPVSLVSFCLLVVLSLGASSCALYDEPAALDPALAVKSLKIDPDPVRLELYQTTQLSARLYDQAGKEVDGLVVDWTSGNESIATVDPSGEVTAKAIGDTTITATIGDVSTTTTVVVFTPVKHVDITPDPAFVDVGANEQLSATVYGDNDTVMNGRTIEWSSSDESIVTVDEEGQITGVAEGQATIRAKATGVTGTVDVTVREPVDHIKLDQTDATIDVTDTVQLGALVIDVNDKPRDDCTVTWTSSKPEVASVDDSGLVEGLKEGVATITAACDGKQAEATITVNAPVDAVAVSPNPGSVNVADTLQLQATLTDAADNELTGRSVTWESSDDTIATVDANGMVSGLKGGDVTITATSEGVSGTAQVTVANPVDTVEVSPDPLTMNVLDTHQMTANLADAAGNALTGRTVTWRSDDTSVATVDASGVVTAKSAGTVNISATAEGVSGSAEVTVENPVTTVEVTPASPTLEVTDTTQLTATAKDVRGNVMTGHTVTWTSTDPTVVTVDSNGNIEALKGGSATIKAQVDNVVGTAEVTVDAPVRSVTLTPTAPAIEVTKTVQLSAQLADKGGNVLTGRTITWTSSDDTVASVDANGLVTGLKGGTVTITAQADAATDSVDVTVDNPVRSVDISPASPAVQVAATTSLTATPRDLGGNALAGYTVTWSSNNTSVATVSATGAMTADVTGQKGGTATITAAVDDGQGHRASHAVDITVDDPVATVEFSPAYVFLFPGDQAQINVTLRDANGNALSGRTVTWTTLDSSIATVDANGLVTAVANGSTSVKATSEGVSNSVTVDVVHWSQVSAGQSYSCGVISNGNAYCWGQNTPDGVLGDGTTDSGTDASHNHNADKAQPTLVHGGLNFKMVSASIYHTCGLTNNGKAYCWGFGQNGALGSAVFANSATPVAVNGNYVFTDIGLGTNHTCALDTTGDLYCWGSNQNGQLGLGAGGQQFYAIPQKVPGHKFVDFAMGAAHTCAISQAGPTYCWGDGTSGQLGDGNATSSDQLVKVSTPEPLVAIASGYSHVCGLGATGKMYCWGDNQYGQDGDGTTTQQNTPVRADSTRTYNSLEVGAGTTCGILSNGDAYCWGFNGQANLGTGGYVDSQPTPTLVAGGHRWSSIILGLQHTCGVATGEFNAFCWGDNQWGQVGDGTKNNDITVPTSVLNP